MRILFSSTSGAGHFGPLVPFVRSCLRGGHDVLVAGPASLEGSVTPTGAGFWPFGDPPPEDMATAFGRLQTMSHDEANAWVVSEVFARLDATAAVPRLREAMTAWRPDVVVRESAEFGAAVAAELHDVPHARVGIGLGVVEHLFMGIAGANIDALRHSHGLAGGHRLAEAPYLTMFPAGLEDPAVADPPRTLRFRDPSWAVFTAAPEPARPFVYVTFGSVAGGMPHLAAVYAAALEAVADLDADVLLTVGRATDPATLGTPPPHVRVEPWVDQLEVLGRASAVVCHGGGGSTLGALAAGVPLVVVPLFAEDQHINARQVAAVGAGLHTPADADAIRAALHTILGEESYRATARGLAAQIAAHHSTDNVLAALR